MTSLLLPTRAAVLLLTCPFWASALVKAADLSGTATEVAHLGLPLPWGTALATILVQGLGSLCLIFGLVPRWAAAALILFTLAASFLAHPFWRLPPEVFLPNFAAFTANMGLIGGLVLAALLSTTSKGSRS
ncbi:DoxX family protein [Arenibacterium sp. LLYu02]|uniref:DoxX family protein n=1 Tax=Arenibacterium sp. LLYu02 TaxID=3404132 RepID=UPI003B211C8E